MSDLRTLLARMLVQQGDHHTDCLPPESSCPVGDEMVAAAVGALATPEGKSLAALVEAAEAWADEERPGATEVADMTAAADLAAAIDVFRQAAR